jgi:hypothetical protein
MVGTMDARFGMGHMVLAALLLFSILCWIIFMAGLAATNVRTNVEPGSRRVVPSRSRSALNDAPALI